MVGARHGVRADQGDAWEVDVVVEIYGRRHARTAEQRDTPKARSTQKRGIERVRIARDLDHAICAAPLRHSLDLFRELRVEGVKDVIGAELLRQFAPLGRKIERDDRICAADARVLDRELTKQPKPDDHTAFADLHPGLADRGKREDRDKSEGSIRKRNIVIGNADDIFPGVDIVLLMLAPEADDTVAGADVGDPGSDLLDDAADAVAEDARPGTKIAARTAAVWVAGDICAFRSGAQSAVAGPHADRPGCDLRALNVQQLCRIRRCKSDLLHCCHSPFPYAPFRTTSTILPALRPDCISSCACSACDMGNTL